MHREGLPRTDRCSGLQRVPPAGLPFWTASSCQGLPSRAARRRAFTCLFPWPPSWADRRPGRLARACRCDSDNSTHCCVFTPSPYDGHVPAPLRRTASALQPTTGGAAMRLTSKSTGRCIPMTIVGAWTGQEATDLRAAFRMPITEFSALTGIGERTISLWKEGEPGLHRPPTCSRFSMSRCGPGFRCGEGQVRAAVRSAPRGGESGWRGRRRGV